MDVTLTQLLGCTQIDQPRIFRNARGSFLAFNDIRVVFEIACEDTISASTLPQPIGELVWITSQQDPHMGMQVIDQSVHSGQIEH